MIQNTFFRQCARLFRALDLYDFLASSVNDDSVKVNAGDNDDDVMDTSEGRDERSEDQDIFESVAKFETDDVDVDVDVDVDDSESIGKFSVEEFSSCFRLRHLVSDSGEKIGDGVSVDALKLAESKFSNRLSLLKFCCRLSKQAGRDFDATK